MAFEGLMGKMRKGLAVAALGLASLMPTQEADAQTILMNVNVRDANHYTIEGNQLKEGQTYFVDFNMTVTDIPENSTIDFSAIQSGIKFTFSNGYSLSDADFGYVQSTNPAGVPPSNDLFSGFDMDLNKFDNYTQNGPNQAIFNFERIASGNGSPNAYPILGPGETRNVASFYFTPSSSAIGALIEFGYDVDLFAVRNSNNDPYGNIQFMNGSDIGVSYSLAAVPEPSTYAAWAGAAVLAGAAWHRRRQRKNAVKAEAA